MKKEGSEIIKRTCPYCGKIITSLYLKQAENNLIFHVKNCKEREGEFNGESK